MDTAPINAIFDGFKSLNVEHIQVTSSDEISPKILDTLIEKIAPTTFVLSHYLFSQVTSWPNKIKAFILSPYFFGTFWAVFHIVFNSLLRRPAYSRMNFNILNQLPVISDQFRLYPAFIQ